MNLGERVRLLLPAALLGKLADVESVLRRLVEFRVDGSLEGLAAGKASSDGTIRLSPSTAAEVSAASSELPRGTAGVLGEEIMHLVRRAEGYPAIQPQQLATLYGYDLPLSGLSGQFEEHSFFPFLETLGLDPRSVLTTTIDQSGKMLPTMLQRIEQDGQTANWRVRLSTLFVHAMTFTEANTVEQMILDAVGRKQPLLAREESPAYGALTASVAPQPTRWEYVFGPQLPRQNADVMVESWVREALVGLNAEIAEQPDRADEVIYALRAILLSVQADGLVRANENFVAWLRGEKTMPFGPNGQHVTVRLVDADVPMNNRLTVANQWTYQTGRRAFLLLRFSTPQPARPLLEWRLSRNGRSETSVCGGIDYSVSCEGSRCDCCYRPSRCRIHSNNPRRRGARSG